MLILGAGGFIGTHLRSLLADRYRLLSLDIRRPEPIAARLGSTTRSEELLLEVDLGHEKELLEAWARLEPHHESIVGVCHLAAHYDFANRPDRRYERLRETLPLFLELMAKDLQPGTPLAYASSMAAIAPTEPGEKQTEDSPRLGAWQYPASKLAMEGILDETPSPHPMIQLVLAAVYSDRCELVPLYQQLARMEGSSIEKYFYPGPADRGLSYVHVTDCAQAFEAAIQRFRGTQGKHRFLIGEPEPVTYGELHDRSSLAFHGKRVPLVRIPKWMARTGAFLLGAIGKLFGRRRFIQPWMVRMAGEHFELDLSHTREGLGWEPKIQMKHRLDRMLDFAVHHRDLWHAINRQRPW